MMSTLLAEFAPYLIGLLGVIGVYFFGKQKGKHQQETKELINNYEKQEKARTISKEIDNETNNYSDDELFAAADKWVRDQTKTK